MLHRDKQCSQFKQGNAQLALLHEQGEPTHGVSNGHPRSVQEFSGRTSVSAGIDPAVGLYGSYALAAPREGGQPAS